MLARRRRGHRQGGTEGDYINPTVGLQELGALTAKSPKSLMRMFGPNGNPQARNPFEIIGYL